MKKMKEKIMIGVAVVGVAASASISVLAWGLSSTGNQVSAAAAWPKVSSNMAVDGEKAQQEETIVNDQSLTKQNIFNKMLNSVDYYQSVYGSFEVSNAAFGDQTVSYQAGLEDKVSYQKIEGTGIDQEQYYQNNEQIKYDNKARTYRVSAVAEFVEEPQLRSGARITENEDGTKNYFYRGDVTHTGFASSMSLLPQEMAFGFLEDFSLWEITGTETYLGREAVRIEGLTEEAYGDKLSVESFVFLVDRATGILLRYDGYDQDGALTDSMHTTQIAIDQGLSINLNARSNKYEGYTELVRGQ